MKTVRLLHVRFKENIKRHELPAFRGAIIEKTGRKSVLFHNHIDDQTFLHRYPHIQYKYFHGKPGLLCLAKGTEAVHHFFGNPSWSIQLSDRDIHLSVDALDLKDFVFKINGKAHSYRIKNWLGLNQKNIKAYNELPGLAEKINLLERILTGNILSMAKSFDWIIEDPIRIQIQQIEKQYVMPLKGIPLSAFDLQFTSNVTLPQYIGLGKGAGQGFGMVEDHLINRK